MRTMSFIGSILALIIPFSYVSISVNDQTVFTASYALFWLTVESSVSIFGIQFSSSSQESFNIDWLASDGVYGAYFGSDLWWTGIIIILLLILSMYFAATKTTENTSAFLLLGAGILLLVIRLLRLGDQDLSYYDSNSIGTYIEIPIGFLIALIFSILDLRQD